MDFQTIHSDPIQRKGWQLDKAIMQTRNRSSPSSHALTIASSTTQSDEPKLHSPTTLSPSVVNIITLEDHYMSSEEGLSAEDSSFEDDMQEFENLEFLHFRVAVEVEIIYYGKARLVDIPAIPSLTNSPSVQSTASSESVNGTFEKPSAPERSNKRGAVAILDGIQYGPGSTSSIDPNQSTKVHIISSSIPSTPITPISASDQFASFLGEDPFQNKKRSSQSRLRSFSGKFSRFVIKKDKDQNSDSVPSSPHSPDVRKQSFRKRSSALTTELPISIPSTPISARLPSIDLQTFHQNSHQSRIVPESPTSAPKKRLIPRGASEREPTIELPPYTADELYRPRRSSLLGL